MPEESLDPRPLQEAFAGLPHLSAAAREPRELESWLRHWNEHEGYWTNLRDIEHWIARSHR